MSVKITIPTYLANLLAPHTCCGCNIVGTLLCDNCKNDIIRDPLYRCLECGQPTLSGQCQTCSLPYAAAWCALQREGALERLINRYKFERAQAAQHTLAHLLDAVTPPLPADAIIVPIPTIPAHQRQRGYDHCRLLAQAFARLRAYPASQSSHALKTAYSWGVAVPSASSKPARHSLAPAHSHQRSPTALSMIFLQRVRRFTMLRVASAPLVPGRLLRW